MKTTAYDIIENQDLGGKAFFFTGGYAGLGAINTKALLMANAKVIITGRSAKAQAEFVQQLRDDSELNYEDQQVDASHTLDLGDLESVKNFAYYIKENYNQIDCLINNAGVMNTPPGKTKDGFETQMGINVVGHFLLSKILVDITRRQIWLSSKGHIRFGAPRIDLEAITNVDEATYVPRSRYQQAKLGDILLAKQFAKQYPHLKAVSVHPGGVKTNLARHMTLGQKMKFILTNPFMVMSMVSPEEGAATQVMVSTIPDEELSNGAYYSDCKMTEEAQSARNMEDAKKLFDYCDKVTKAYQS
ncbi:MAG: SDR family NAD(P)-dependent oxidoreductase [Bacteroidota bacterium]